MVSQTVKCVPWRKCNVVWRSCYVFEVIYLHFTWIHINVCFYKRNARLKNKYVLTRGKELELMIIIFHWIYGEKRFHINTCRNKINRINTEFSYHGREWPFVVNAQLNIEYNSRPHPKKLHYWINQKSANIFCRFLDFRVFVWLRQYLSNKSHKSCQGDFQGFKKTKDFTLA